MPFTKNGYRKTLSTYINMVDFGIGYYKLIQVRTYSSPTHNILHELFSRIKIFDYSNDKHIHAILRVFETSADNANKKQGFTDISYSHYHYIGMDPSVSFIICKPTSCIRYESQFIEQNLHAT